MNKMVIKYNEKQHFKEYHINDTMIITAICAFIQKAIGQNIYAILQWADYRNRYEIYNKQKSYEKVSS